MSVRIERDPAWWEAIASHPALAGALHGVAPATIGQIATMPTMLPLAAEHGGFMFGAMDGFGFVRELHTLFTPEGWGREAITAGVEALEMLFGGPCEIVVTYEQEDNRRSRAPRGFGFAMASERFAETRFGGLRCWLLTRMAWEAAPVRKRAWN